VVGAVGCGKTTLARAIASGMTLPYFELDALKYGPLWTETPNSTFAARVAGVAAGDRWVIDGNYEAARHFVWSRADLVVWLDYPLPLVVWRLLWRTLRRLVTREKFANGNREQLNRLLSGRSVILWAIRSHHARRRGYERLLQGPRYKHLLVERLRNPAAAANLLERLSKGQPTGVL
jgi:adenylate kinase family enzyme